LRTSHLLDAIAQSYKRVRKKEIATTRGRSSSYNTNTAVKSQRIDMDS
jgi:hypothetical protein